MFILRIFIALLVFWIARGIPKVVTAYRRGDDLPYDLFGKEGVIEGKKAKPYWLAYFALHVIWIVIIILVAWPYLSLSSK